ncbi:MAG TPA: single-stranded DNA-binding protein [Candidatus Acidoferrum sp.]|jgi:single-strand DNA-binding protein|nr:single-stranded DNA-binding protein [Candidatus Acidoferrum sp.]
MYYNISILVGYLGSDAEQRETKSGAKYTVLSLGTKRSWKNAQGEYESRTYWHRAVAWGRLADFAATLKKGMHVQLVGELRTRVYEKEYGNRKKFTVQQRVCEIALQSILKLDRAERQEEPAPDVDPSDLPAELETGAATVPSDDVPF